MEAIIGSGPSKESKPAAILFDNVDPKFDHFDEINVAKLSAAVSSNHDSVIKNVSNPPTKN